MNPIWRIFVVGAMTVYASVLVPIQATAADLTVNLTDDTGNGVCSDGMCTLRDAILEANAPPFDIDTILFNIPDSAITPTSPLPAITAPVIMDGFSDPTSSRVELTGSSVVAPPGTPPDGLRLSTADNSTIKGLVINGFAEDGIHLQTGAGNNHVEGNFIGLNADGTLSVPNVAGGLHIQGSNNVIGGSPDLRNVISGNGGNGVRIAGAGASRNRIEGNYIGTNAAGNAAVPNTANGIAITSDADNNVIGGTSSALRNVISGNGNNGIRIFVANTTGNVVQGNYIGTTSDGSGTLGNGLAGIGIDSDAAGNTVGGSASGAGNLISGNTQDGVEINGAATTGNPVLGNSISDNGNTVSPHRELGIDLVGMDGVDANDPGDLDTGPNNLQNFPVLASAASNATATTISGTLNSQPSTIYRLEFFSNDACDPSGNGEGQTFLGATSVTTDSSGNVNFTASSLAGGAAGKAATATATDPANNTSEFSACRTVALAPTPPVTGPPAPPPPAPPPPPARCPGFQSDTRAQFVGTAGNDVLEGTSGRDIICGLGGNDTIRGLGRGDVLIGGPGADILIGGRGNDIVRGGRGRDVVRGGRGRDIVRGGGGRDTLLGGRSADTLLGGRGNDVLRAGPGPGRDVLDGGRGRDRCRGGRGNDVFRRCEE